MAIVIAPEIRLAAAIARARPPTSRMGLVESVAQQILDLIAEENLTAGDRLPATRLLAQRFQVAMPTMREVLRHLQATGAIDVRQGSGIYVRHEHQRIMVVNPNLGALHPRTALDLLGVRLLLEPPVAALTARMIDETGIATLEETLAEAEAYLGGDGLMLHQVNMSFHLGIARCTGNVVLTHMMESLIELYAAEEFAVIVPVDARFQDYEEHKALLAAIRDRDPDRAHRLMERHIAQVQSVVETRLREHEQA